MYSGYPLFHFKYWLFVSSFFILLVLLEINTFYWSFSKNQLFCFTDFFSIFYYFQFHWFLLLFFISFFLLMLGLFHSCFYGFLRYEILLLISDLSLFLMWIFSARNFPLSTALATSHIFWSNVILFSLNSMYF